MLKFPSFSNQPALANYGNVSSTYINGVKNNLETYINSFDTITDTIKIHDTPIRATDYINPVDASGTSGGVYMTLPQISTLSGLVGGFYFKKIDVSTNPVFIKPFSEGIEDLRNPQSSPNSSVLTLDLPDQSVLIYPVNNIWRVFQHYLPISSVGCRAYLNNVQNIATPNQFVKIAFDTEDYDIRSLFDITQSQFTAPVKGLYQIAGVVGMYSSSGTHTFLLSAFINNNQSRALFFMNNIQSSQDIDMPFTSLIRLNKGDILNLYITSSQVFYVRSGASLTYLEIQLISL